MAHTLRSDGAATIQQMEVLDQRLAHLESMLETLNGIDKILDFNPSLLSSTEEGTGTAKGGEKHLANPKWHPSQACRFRPGTIGVAILAESAADDLRKWRRGQEEKHARFSEIHRQKLRAFVANRASERARGEEVRVAIKKDLCRQAAETLRTQVADVAAIYDGGESAYDGEDGAGAEALAKLHQHLEGILGYVTSVTPKKPDSMVRALSAAEEALERKQKRMHAQQSRSIEMHSHLGQDILREADRSTSSRRAAFVQQTNRQAAFMRMLLDAQHLRQSAQRDLCAAANRAASPVSRKLWKPLWPRGSTGKPLDEESMALQKAYSQVLERGEAQVAAICADFKNKFFENTQEQVNAAGELELWKLSTRQNLLEEMQDSLQESHNQVIASLEKQLRIGDTGFIGQLDTTMESAEDFVHISHDTFSESESSAKEALAELYKEGLDKLVQRRRQSDISALKRSADLRSHISTVLATAEADCIQELGTAAHRMLQQCHSALPFLGNYCLTQASLLPGDARFSSSRWSQTSAADGMRLVSDIVPTLPSTAEGCAISKAALVILCDELRRVSEGCSINSEFNGHDS